jgi:hypothetical protein
MHAYLVWYHTGEFMMGVVEGSKYVCNQMSSMDFRKYIFDGCDDSGNTLESLLGDECLMGIA